MSRTRSRPLVLARCGDLIAERDPLRPSGRLLRQAGMEASYVDLADPSHLEFDYLRWIRVILAAAGARRTLHIGGGACALPRALAVRDPDGLQEVCEPDAAVLEIAREHFGLRRISGLRIRQVEGREFLSRQPDASFDAVVIDAFIGAVVPPALITAEALGDAARVASLTAVNVVDDRSARVVQAVATGLASANRGAWRVAGRSSNSVLVGGALERHARERIAAELGRDPSPARLTEVRGATERRTGS